MPARTLISLAKEAAGYKQANELILSGMEREAQMHVDPKQWVQPLFMIYEAGTDQQVPLTQERLDQLIATEMQYGRLICHIRDSHAAHADRLGFKSNGFAPV